MPELMNHVEFRTALENAIKGKSANKAPFSIAWASGKLSRAHLGKWAENHYHYVGPFADYLAYIYARMPEQYIEAKDFLLANMYEEEIGGDRHTDLLIRFAEACGTTRARVIDPDNMIADHARSAELVLCGGDARGSDRRGRRPGGRPGVAGAVDLSQADADAARKVQVHRPGSRILRSAHRIR